MRNRERREEVNIRCIYCGFEVGTGLRCCGVTYNLNGTYQITPDRKRPSMAHGPVSAGMYEDAARRIASKAPGNPPGDPKGIK
jgi:hypothetical protein